MGDLKPADLIDSGSFFRMGVSPQMIEILPQISGVTLEDAWQLSADDLITNKLASGRHQDLADVDAVRAAQRLRPEPEAPKSADKRNGGPQT